jgi:hypothetical protein
VCGVHTGVIFGVGMANPTVHISPKCVDVGRYGSLMVVVMKRNMNSYYVQEIDKTCQKLALSCFGLPPRGLEEFISSDGRKAAS